MGIGTRVALNESSRLGIGVLTENEKDIENVSQQTERFAAYYHDDFELSENIDLNTTIYYQPSLDNFDEDYKASFLTALDFTVNDNFKISLQYSTFYDSSPPILAFRHDEQISTNFSYSF